VRFTGALGARRNPMSAQGNKALALRAWEVVFNQRNLDALHEFYATDAVWHQPEQDIRGI
jgi:hypothetical protein